MNQRWDGLVVHERERDESWNLEDIIYACNSKWGRRMGKKGTCDENDHVPRFEITREIFSFVFFSNVKVWLLVSLQFVDTLDNIRKMGSKNPSRSSWSWCAWIPRGWMRHEWTPVQWNWALLTHRSLSCRHIHRTFYGRGNKCLNVWGSQRMVTTIFVRQSWNDMKEYVEKYSTTGCSYISYCIWDGNFKH